MGVKMGVKLGLLSNQLQFGHSSDGGFDILML
jgi:hypothetical protein